uniref:Malonyl-CoA:ACP transacylase (MAT) domain-containing protein n=1 Tax=Eutreptiella gymnastica TaxID=73025 RepID=A0A7S4FPY5_9EUGL
MSVEYATLVPKPSESANTRCAVSLFFGLTAGVVAALLMGGTSNQNLYATGVRAAPAMIQRAIPTAAPRAAPLPRVAHNTKKASTAEDYEIVEANQYMVPQQTPQQLSTLALGLLCAAGGIGGALFGRAMAMRPSAPETSAQLQSIAMMSTAAETATGALMFPGQGTQFVGMAADVIEKNGPGKALFDRASEVLGYDLTALLLEGPAEKLNATSYSQPAVMVSSLAALEELKAENPDLMAGIGHVAGFSLGEITALVAAGALSFEDGLKLVKVRAEAMQASCDLKPSGMGSITGLSDEQMEELISGTLAETSGSLQIANYLFPGGRVISGDVESVDIACEKAKEMGAAAASKLVVAGAFHTAFMDPAKEAVAAALADIEVKLPSGLNLYSNVTAEPYTSAEQIKELLVQQVVSPVKWEQTAATLGALDGDLYEIGAGQQLKAMMKRVDKKAFRRVTTVGGWRPPRK